MAASDDPRSDVALLQATPRDPEAFGVFYRRHVTAILRFFVARTHDPELAADLMAETFAAALLGVKKYRAGPEPAVSWLYGIAKNKLADSRRRGRVADRARRRLRLEPLVLDDEDIARVAELDERAVAQGQEALARLHELPEDQRSAVLARVVDERDYPEIAQEMRCSEAVVRQRVSRGLRTLREQIQETT